MPANTIGNVSLRLVEADGKPLDAIGWQHQLLVGQWRQDDQSTPLDDWLNAILFQGSLVEIREPETQAHKDALARMIDTTGMQPSDHALLHADLFSSRNTWSEPTVGVWPESRIGQRVHPSPGLWFRVWGPVGSIVGAIVDGSKSLPPFCTPTIDNRRELTSLSTCCHHMTMLKRVVEVGMRFHQANVVDAKTPDPLRRAFGTRYLPERIRVADKTVTDWWPESLLPFGLYSSWWVWARDVLTGRTDTALLLVSGYAPRLHPHFPWNFNTEHWGAGSDFSPMCVGAMGIEVLRQSGQWEPAPRVHFHSELETPNHAVYAGNGAVVISTEAVDMKRMAVGEIVDPRRVGVLAYTTRTGTRTILTRLAAKRWRLLLTPDASALPAGWDGGYALDNGAWGAHQRGARCDVQRFAALLAARGAASDWVVAPDVVGDGAASWALTQAWLASCLSRAPRVLIAVQDGMTPATIRARLGERVGIFVGGSTGWKLAMLAQWGALAAQTGCWLHVARVNTRRRLDAAMAVGATSFDGNGAMLFAKHQARMDGWRKQGGLWARPVHP